MSLISFTPLADGVTAVNAAATNTPLSTIYNDYNGNITDANVAAGAAIAGSKINLASIANPYKFKAVLGSAFSTTGGASVVVPFDTSSGTYGYDTGGNVDITTHKGRFTAPIAGFYQFNTMIACASAPGTFFLCTILKNGTEYQRLGQIQASNAADITGSDVLKLAANDFVEIAVQTSTNGIALITTSSAGLACYFSGFLVSAT